RTRYLVGWCEMKEDYRHFKTERVQELRVLGKKYPGRRATLLKGWEEATTKRMRS
ncbi:WYL domain-containing protein, partial [uncultured Pelagimonas sp.]